GERTAINGKWTKGPGIDFFNTLKHDLPDLPFIAEDLGEIDQDVLNLRDSFKLPGMKVLMFAFGAEMPDSIHLPHNYPSNSIVYTGTHDNNTARGWYNQSGSSLRARLTSYLGKHPTSSSVSWDMIRLAQTSVSKTAIIPVQDILGLDESARLNTPARSKGNWKWKLADFNDLAKATERLNKLCYYSGRI
ncbi:MAG TPA: 4-alpha-glucanotransferase, partial [Bacteroidales bacterium]|nr:4-alpha-glucanotransferase [Bacteroidales bacterium]